jgi:hypothetical protein
MECTMQRSIQAECVDVFAYLGEHVEDILRLSADTAAATTTHLTKVEPSTIASTTIKVAATAAVTAYVAYKAPLLLLLLIPAALKAVTRDRCTQ